MSLEVRKSDPLKQGNFSLPLARAPHAHLRAYLEPTFEPLPIFNILSVSVQLHTRSTMALKQESESEMSLRDTATPESSAPDYDLFLDIAPFADIPRLRGTENWDEWHQSIRSEFQEQEVWHFVTGAERPNPPCAQIEQTWRRLEKRLCALLSMTVDRTIMAEVPQDIDIDMLYAVLRIDYEPHPRFPDLLKEISTLRLEQFSSVAQYADHFLNIYIRMERCFFGPHSFHDSFSLVMLNTFFLEGLGPEWEAFRNLLEPDIAIKGIEVADLIQMTMEAQRIEDSWGIGGFKHTTLFLLRDRRLKLLSKLTRDQLQMRQPAMSSRRRLIHEMDYEDRNPFCRFCRDFGHKKPNCWLPEVPVRSPPDVDAIAEARLAERDAKLEMQRKRRRGGRRRNAKKRGTRS